MSAMNEACLACGHTEPHDLGEYEDTHVRCQNLTDERVAGYECGHKRWRKACEDEHAGLGGCYTVSEFCECSSEDREIAALKAELAKTKAELADAIARVGSCAKIEAEERLRGGGKVMNRHRDKKTRNKAKAFHRHGKHGGMRGIVAALNRSNECAPKRERHMVDAREIKNLFR